MASQIDIKLKTSNSMPDKKMKISMWVAGILFAFFGVLTIQYGYSLIVGQRPWSAVFVYLISGYTLNIAEPGMHDSKANFMYYREMMANMSTHTVLGGLIMIFGLSQFVPSIRRKHPKIHRSMGALLGLSMLLVCITSFVFLFSTPATSVLAGVPFWFILFELTVLPLFFILQAAFAIKQRAFRDHMVWMGLTFACFLTAPFLRFNYAITGQLEEQVINRLVLNSSPSIFLQTFILFALWLVFVGEKDLPNREKTVSMSHDLKSKIILQLASVVGLVAVLALGYEVVVENFEASHTMLLAMLSIVFVAKFMQIQNAGNNWALGKEGMRPNKLFTISTVLSSAALFGLGTQLNTSGYYLHALSHCLVHLAAIEVVVLALAYLTPTLSTGRNLFAMFCSALSWSWSGIAVLTGLLIAYGYSNEIALVTAIAVAPAFFAGYSIVVASGISTRYGFKVKA